MPPQTKRALPDPVCPTAHPTSAKTPSCAGRGDQEHPFLIPPADLLGFSQEHAGFEYVSSYSSGAGGD